MVMLEVEWSKTRRSLTPATLLRKYQVGTLLALPIGGILLEELLERHMGRNGMRFPCRKGIRQRKAPAAQHTGKEQQAEEEGVQSQAHDVPGTSGRRMRANRNRSCWEITVGW